MYKKAQRDLKERNSRVQQEIAKTGTVKGFKNQYSVIYNGRTH